MNEAVRTVMEQIVARPASDGDGVNLLRVFGGQKPERFDPFLMLDEFGSEDASDYIGGFPSHPHRGFETVTYMLQGKMEHKDHMGNVGLIDDGDVQWMTAGRGVIHSEMPRQTEGKMRGFQLWVNLPAAKKMKPANYEDIKRDKIPVFQRGNVTINAIAGSTEVNAISVEGYLQVEDTDVVFLDIHMAKQSDVAIQIPAGYTSLVYVYEGDVHIGQSKTLATSQTLSRLSTEGSVQVQNVSDADARVLILAGKPLKEPIVQYGPFVMNSVEQIEQAVRDYQRGVLTD